MPTVGQAAYDRDRRADTSASSEHSHRCARGSAPARRTVDRCYPTSPYCPLSQARAIEEVLTPEHSGGSFGHALATGKDPWSEASLGVSTSVRKRKRDGEKAKAGRRKRKRGKRKRDGYDIDKMGSFGLCFGDATNGARRSWWNGFSRFKSRRRANAVVRESGRLPSIRAGFAGYSRSITDADLCVRGDAQPLAPAFVAGVRWRVGGLHATAVDHPCASLARTPPPNHYHLSPFTGAMRDWAMSTKVNTSRSRWRARSISGLWPDTLSATRWRQSRLASGEMAVVKLVATLSSYGRRAVAVGGVADLYASELARAGQSNRRRAGTGSASPECATRPPLWPAGMAEGNRETFGPRVGLWSHGSPAKGGPKSKHLAG